MKIINLTASLIVLSFLTSCAPTISNFNAYKNQRIPNSNYMPSKELLKGKAPKVVIFDFLENDNQVAFQANLGKSLAVGVENILTENRLVELVDRKIAKKLEEEIKLAQMSDKAADYSGPVIADFAISGAIGNATFNKKYSAGKTMYDKERGYYKTPAKFNYSSEVAGNVKIYELPSMSVVENLEFSGYAGKSENVQKKGGVSIGGLLEIGGESAQGSDRDDGLVRLAGENAINDVSANLKNVFAKKGYILERRTFKNKSIFKISLGSKDGVRQGDRFEIIGKFEIENPITGDSEIESRILASGRISNVINPETSFVILDKKDQVDNVRIGDVVKLKYQKTLVQKLNKYSKYIPN